MARPRPARVQKEQEGMRAARRLLLVVQRLGNVGGQERSTLEVVRRLALMGWSIELLSFDLSDWPQSLPIAWQRVPRLPIRLALLQNLWFALVAAIVVGLKRRQQSPPLVMTIGTAAPLADVRVVQFVHGAALAAYRLGLMPYPNAPGPLRHLYQVLFARIEAAIERHWLAKCRQIIAISRSVARDAYAYSGQTLRCPVDVVWHAVDLLPPASRAVPARGEPVTILFVGALERKGIARALGALQHVKDLPWRLRAVGGGDITRWQKVAADLGMADRVEFTGACPAVAHFPTADLFLLPSAYEPFGLVVTEAVSFGLVPLVSRECGAMDHWPKRPEWLGLSCRDSEQIWAQSLRRLLEDPNLRSSMAAQARRAMGSWTWEHAAERYNEILRRLMATEERRAA